MTYIRQIAFFVLILPSISGLYVSNALSQDRETIRFEHLTPVEGLSQSTGRSILQDSEGFLWIGTSDGLNRFNGYNINVYKHDPEDPSSISYNEISDLFEDSQGNLWIATVAGGINLYNRDLDSFRHFSADPSLPLEQRLLNSTTYAIAEDDSGRIWIGTEQGLSILNPETNRFEHLQNEPGNPRSLSDNYVRYLYRDSEGAMWVGTDNGLNRYNSDTRDFDWFFYSASSIARSNLSYIQTIYEARDGSFWIGTQRGGLIRLNRMNGSYETFEYDSSDSTSISDNSIYSILEDNRGVFWIGTENGGLNVFDRENRLFHRYQFDAGDPNSLSNDAVYTLYLSRDNILWVGTYNGGVNYTDRNYPRFEHYRQNPVEENSLSINSVLSFTEDDSGIIWIGTDGGGLNRFNPETRDFDVFRHEEGNSNSIGGDVVMALETGPDNAIWAGMYRGGMSRFSPSNGQFQNYSTQSTPALNNNDIFALYVDPEDSPLLWVGSNGEGINLLNTETGDIEYYLNNPSDPSSLTNNYIRDFYLDRQDRFWIGHYGGDLSEMDRSTGEFTTYNLADGNVLAGAVQTIYEDRFENLWLATRGGGLKLFDRESGTVQSFTENDGLANNMVQGILEDDWGFLWLSTNNGISRFEIETQTFFNYSVDAGLQSVEFNSGSYYRDSSGYMYFGGVNGFNRFHPDSVSVDMSVSPVVLTDFRIFNQSVRVGADSPLKKQISRAEEIVLPWDSSVLTFEYVALNYSVNKGNTFAYRLTGFDGDWNYVDDQRTATYTNLSPGEYTFEVQAANSDGVWGEQMASISLIITPPFWQTAWFYILSALVLTGFVVGGYRYRVRSITEQNRRLGQEVKRQTAELFEKNSELEKTLGELKKTRGELIEKAHKAGMADLATNVLHNVGNILNSVNVSTTLIDEILTRSKLKGLKKANALLRDHEDDMESFIVNDPRGKKLLEYYLKLDGAIDKEYEELKTQKDRLSDNVNLIIDVVAAQQSYSQAGRLFERVSLEKLLEDTLTLQAATIERHGLQIERSYGQVAKVEVEKSKLVHTLINILKNAKEAMEGLDPSEKRLELTTFEEPEWICVSVKDSGVGVSKQELAKIFTHGYTTKESGHGFGLHSCANYMQEIGGEIRVESDGKGKGTTITLCFPKTKSTSSDVKGRPSELIDSDL